jgi:hypothetical protein
MPHDLRSASAPIASHDDAAPALPVSAAQVARVRLHDASRDTLLEILGDPWVTDALAELVPLLKISDVLPCLEVPGLVGRLVPCLSPAQCKQVGPELAAHVAPHLAARWSQLAHLPVETLVLMPTAVFASLPAGVLRTLPPAHQAYLAPYVKRVRNVSAADHDLALCEALCEILHVYRHKILDPEHIPSLARLGARASLAGELQRLRWLVDAVMSDAVKVVQLGALKLGTLIVELRRAGLRALANELAQIYQDHKAERALYFGADAIAYTDDHAIAVCQQAVGDLAAIPSALRAAVLHHARLRDEPSDAAARERFPLPTARYLPVIALDLAAGLPRMSAQHALELAIADQLAAPSLGITIEEVCVRWPTGQATTYRRHHNARYRSATPRFGAGS